MQAKKSRIPVPIRKPVTVALTTNNNKPKPVATSLIRPRYTRPDSAKINIGVGTQGTVTISKTEYLFDIASSIPFAIDSSIAINPGLSGQFPWLASVANSWEIYKFIRLVYHYKPTSGSAVSTTNPALGVVILATQYNSLDAPFITKQQMENYQGAVSTVPYQSVSHNVLKGLTRNAQLPLTDLYIRSSAVPSGADQRMYDIGVLVVAVQGMPANGNIVGELWVDYTVELIKPRIPTSPTIVTSASAHWFGVVPTSLDIFTNVTFNSGTLILTKISNTTFSLPIVGTYQVTVVVGNGAAATVSPAVLAFGTGASASLLWQGGASTFMSTYNNAEIINGHLSFIVITTVPNATFSLLGYSYSGLVRCDLVVSIMDNFTLT
jgi:hypothetical protein